MKKITILVLMLIAGSTCYAQKYVGGGIAFGSEIESVGLFVNGEYFVTDQISVAPSLIYFAPRDFGSVKIRQSEFNINGNYHFDTDTGLDFYALAGLNFAFISTPIVNPFTGVETRSSNTEVGLNIGGGFNYQWKDNLLPFVEIKYSLSDYDQLVLMGGVKLILK
ncbi:MAG: hypothetical protein WBA74_09180 [Cyclobacteriaceae bacterium]